MPFSFTQIEKDKSARIGFVFSFLVVFYFFVAFVLYWITKLYFLIQMDRREGMLNFSMGLSLSEILIIFSVAIIVGIIHWLISINHIIEKILDILQAKPLNLQDTFHLRFNSILEEMSVATGGVKFEGVVVSSTAMNAFALADFDGRYVVGVTEGLLARLNRAQLESVIAHEAAHILVGDCLQTTITSSMFDLYKDMLSTSKEGMRISSRGNFSAFLIVIYVFLQLTNIVAKFFKMFISREREYRADAIAVRLTRDPLSLAQALYMISQRWRGYGVPGDRLEAIFIVPPQFYELDEEEGFFANLFSTHPPIHKRIEILLDMAHVKIEELEANYIAQSQIKQQPPADIPDIKAVASSLVEGQVDLTVEQWEVYMNGQWRGPYNISDLMTQEWIEHDTFVRKIGSNKVVRLCDASDIKKYNVQGGFLISGINCPICQVNLSDDMYKGAPILKCLNCAGILVYEDDVQKFLARDDYYFSDRIRQIGESIIKHQNNFQIVPVDLKTANLLSCPRCSDPKPKMFRSFYTLAYPVEVDRCTLCRSTWFDRSELEVLQYMIGKNQSNNDSKSI